MILVATLLIGASLGWYRARALKGNTKDKLQYAAVFALIFAIIGLFIAIVIDRNA